MTVIFPINFMIYTWQNSILICSELVLKFTRSPIYLIGHIFGRNPTYLSVSTCKKRGFTTSQQTDKSLGITKLSSRHDSRLISCAICSLFYAFTFCLSAVACVKRCRTWVAETAHGIRESLYRSDTPFDPDDETQSVEARVWPIRSFH